MPGNGKLMPLPDEPLQGVGEIAVALNELFTSLKAATFTDSQALYLTGKLVEGLAARSA